MDHVDTTEEPAEPTAHRRLSGNDLDDAIVRPRRADSWENKVVIFIEANDDLYVTQRSELPAGLKPRAKLPLPRVRSQKHIFIPPQEPKQEDLDQYIATVNISKILKGQRLQRLIGRVKMIYVFEGPLPMRGA